MSGPRARRGGDPPTAEERLHHFLARFSLGATPELVDEVREVGPETWLEGQLAARDLVQRTFGMHERQRCVGSQRVGQFADFAGEGH